MRRLLRSSPERVFDTFLDPECVRDWFGAGAGTVCSVELEPRVSGRFSVGLRRPNGEILETLGVYREIDRPRRLVFSWAAPAADLPEGLVIVEVAASGSGSTVTLTHRLDPSFQDSFRGRRLEIELGWQQMLEAIAGMLEVARSDDELIS